jgi:hypothetical protein
MKFMVNGAGAIVPPVHQQTGHPMSDRTALILTWLSLPFLLAVMAVWTVWDLLFSTDLGVSTGEPFGLIPRLARKAEARRQAREQRAALGQTAAKAPLQEPAYSYMLPGNTSQQSL